MPAIKDEAICLRLYDWSETSQIVVLLTRDHGKHSATAKGAKRQNPSALQRFSGGVELLALGRVELIAKPSTELANLIEWDLADPHWHLRRSFGAFQAGMYAADLAHHLLTDHDPHAAVFQSLAELLKGLAQPGQEGSGLLRYQWTLCEDLGYRPILDRDAQTGQALNGEAAAFSPAAGGVVHATGASDRWPISPGTLEILRHLESGGSPLGRAPASITKANRLLAAYFRAILDKHLPTMDFLMANGKREG